MSLLSALLGNESGGQNIANTTQGTSSGQAQGYFQITTGTWNDFGGQQYASTPLGATYAQQAAIASKIPLKRWDSSTIAAMRATGKPINTNLTLGQNLAMNGETFGSGPTGGTMSMSDYLGQKTGNTLGASSPEQAADQANALRGIGDNGSGIVSGILGDIWNGIQKVAGSGVGGINNPTYGTGDNAPGASTGTSTLSSLIASVEQLFTAQFWESAAAFVLVIIVAAAFLIFGASRIVKSN